MSLDLSFVLKNPKRDLCNGFMTAEICSRYYPKDINILNFENGTRLAAKVDNWEQLYKFFKKKQFGILKQDFDPVIHCAPGAAVVFILKLYQVLTKKMPKLIEPAPPDEMIPPYQRHTASYRLKDHEIDRIADRVDRTMRAIDTLGMYHDERRYHKSYEVPHLLRHERALKARRPGKDFETLSRDINEDSIEVDEVRVKALQGDSTQLRQGAAGGRTGGAPQGGAGGAHTHLLKKVSSTKSAVGALASMIAPALFVKPAMDIMRPLVQDLISKSEDLERVIDKRKDIVVSFMEQCRESVPEDVSVKVFDTLANRAQLLVESLTRSPPEFWKVWSTFYPALTDFPEQSPIFESAVYLFKRLGDLMRESDPTLTQQLITEVGLPSLAKELCRSPEKREALCAIIYSYTQEDTLNHLLVLRALKEKISDLPTYIHCLSCLISRDAELSFLDDYLLDLYIYYALMAMQSPQPKIRVAGLAILGTIATCSSQHQSVQALIPSFVELADDDWWEVQAQLLLLAANLLSKVTAANAVDDGTEGEADTEKVDSPVGAPDKMNMLGGDDAAAQGAIDDVTAQLEDIIMKLFVVNNSKNVLQVGLSALVPLLPDYTNLQPMFMAVLLDQPPPLRRRLLRSIEEEPSTAGGKLTYVWGSSTREYEEKCVSALWPHLDMAKTFVRKEHDIPPEADTPPLGRWEVAHMEVFLATLPEVFEEIEWEEWLAVFDKVKQYIFVALVDPDLHQLSTYIIKKFWLCNLEQLAAKCVEDSRHILLQVLGLLYGNMDCAKVDENLFLDFLKELYNHGGTVQFELGTVIEQFHDTQEAEYQSSKLYTVHPISK
jgi:hypothetical protein